MSCCKRPEQDGTCQANGHAVKAETPVSARILYSLADEVAARAEGVREIYRHASFGGQYDELAGLLVHAGKFCEENRCRIADIGFVIRSDTPRTTDARWLETQAQLYDTQQGERQRELASLIRSMAFLVAAREAPLDELRVIVDGENWQ